MRKTPVTASIVCSCLLLATATASAKPLCSTSEVAEVQSNLQAMEKLRDQGVVPLLRYHEYQRTLYRVLSCAEKITKAQYCQKMFDSWKATRAIIDAYDDRQFRLKSLEGYYYGVNTLKGACDGLIR